MPDGSQIVQRTVADTPAPKRKPAAKKLSLSALVQKFLESDRQWLEALRAAEAEEDRVRKLYPPCPESIWVATRSRHYAPAVQEQIEAAIARGIVKGTEAAKMLADFREWERQREEVDATNVDASLQDTADTLWDQAEAYESKIKATPAATLSDVVAVLRFVANEYTHFAMEPEDAAKLLTSLTRLVAPDFPDIELTKTRK